MSPQKRQGKGSFPVPYPKMPFGIFLFAQKFNFQKSEENGEKRRKPEKISGFSVGIFFVNTCWRRHPEARPSARGDEPRTGSLALRAAGARSDEGVASPKQKAPLGVLFVLRRVDKKDANLFCILYLIFHQFHCITLGVV